MNNNGRNSEFFSNSNGLVDHNRDVAGPSRSFLQHQVVQKRIDGEREERESIWRRAEDDERPIQLDDYDRFLAQRLACSLIETNRNTWADNINMTLNSTDEVNNAIQNFVREISPRDREKFWDMIDKINLHKITLICGRERVATFIHYKDWEDASESAAMYRKELLSITNPSQYRNAQMSLDRKILLDQGRSGLRPDGSNMREWSEQKTREEFARSERAQNAKLQRRLRRALAAEEYDRIWKRLDEVGDYTPPDVPYEVRHPRAKEEDQKRDELASSHSFFDNMKKALEQSRNGEEREDGSTDMSWNDDGSKNKTEKSKKRKEKGYCSSILSYLNAARGILDDDDKFVANLKLREAKERELYENFMNEPKDYDPFDPKQARRVIHISGNIPSNPGVMIYPGSNFASTSTKENDGYSSTASRSNNKKKTEKEKKMEAIYIPADDDEETVPYVDTSSIEKIGEEGEIMDEIDHHNDPSPMEVTSPPPHSLVSPSTQPVSILVDDQSKETTHPHENEEVYWNESGLIIVEDEEEEPTTGVEDQFEGLEMTDPSIVSPPSSSLPPPQSIRREEDEDAMEIDVADEPLDIVKGVDLGEFVVHHEPPSPELKAAKKKGEKKKKKKGVPEDVSTAPSGKAVPSSSEDSSREEKKKHPKNDPVNSSAIVPAARTLIELLTAPSIDVSGLSGMGPPSASSIPSTGPPSSADESIKKGENDGRKKARRKKKRAPTMDDNDAALALISFATQGSENSSASRTQSSSSPSPPPPSSLPLQPSPIITSSTLPSTSSLPPVESSTPLQSVTNPTEEKDSEMNDLEEGPSSSSTTIPSSVGSSLPLPLHPIVTPQADYNSQLKALMSYQSPDDSPGGKKLLVLKDMMDLSKNKVDKNASDMACVAKYKRDKNAFDLERKTQQILNYALHKWPVKKYPIVALHQPFRKMKRDEVLKYLGTGNIEPPTETLGEFTKQKLDQLHKRYLAQMGPEEREFPLLAEIPNSTPSSSTPSTSIDPPTTKKRSTLVEKKSSIKEKNAEKIAEKIVAVSTQPDPLPPPPMEITERQPIEKGEEVLAHETVPSHHGSPESTLIESPQRQGLRSRGSSEESERKRKMSEESSEGEPETKRTEKEAHPSSTRLDEVMEDDESRNDEANASIEDVIDAMDTLPPHQINSSMGEGSEDQSESIPIEDNNASIVLSEDEEIANDPDECLILKEVPNSTHVLSRSLTEEEETKEILESTGLVISIQMGPVAVESVPNSPNGSTGTNEQEPPDPSHLAYYLPNRAVSSLADDEDKDDKALVAARDEEERRRIGIESADGTVVWDHRGSPRIVPELKGSFKLLIYLLKTRFDDDLLPSQRNLRHFADIIQNKLISDLREENPNEWSHQFYKVVPRDMVARTLYDPLPNSFEKDLLVMTPSDQFNQWRNGRALTAELLELAVKAETTQFTSLIEETLRLRDAFTIVKARALFRKILSDLESTLDDLKRGDEDENDDFKAIEKEMTEKVKEIFIFSFYVISHSISINNRSRTKLRPYELLRVLAYVLEGWTGWLERGGIYRLFLAICEKKEKEGGYVPLGRERAMKMRDRIESRVSTICRPLRAIEEEGEERAVIYMLHQLKDKDILLESTREIKDNVQTGRTLKCGHNLGNTKAACTLCFKTEEELEAHKNVTHVWRDRENKAATKCNTCVRYFIMESSLVVHKLIAHHDYDEEEEEEEGRGSDGGSSPRDDGEEDGEGETDRQKIKRLSLKLTNLYKLAVVQWNPEEREIKMEEESPSKSRSIEE